MKLTNYVDVIFAIGEQQERDIGIARDMFCANLAAGSEKYNAAKGSRSVDYAALKTTWEALGKAGQAAEKDRYQAVVKTKYEALAAAYKAKRYGEMHRLVGD